MSPEGIVMTARVLAWSPGAAGPLLEQETPWDWTRFSACQYTDPELFFAEGSDAAEVTDVARRICLSCPVRADCLRHALAKPEDHGTWAGLSEKELRDERARVPARPVAVVLDEAAELYFQRQDRKAEAYDRHLAAMRESNRKKAAALLGRAA
jgi:WhiB family transcriptional regulator, redox-sensing transcriptional regulator